MPKDQNAGYYQITGTTCPLSYNPQNSWHFYCLETVVLWPKKVLWFVGLNGLHSISSQPPMCLLHIMLHLVGVLSLLQSSEWERDYSWMLGCMFWWTRSIFFKQVIDRIMTSGLKDLVWLLQATGGEDVIQGRQLLIYDVLCSLYNSLQGLFVCCRAVSKPHQEAVCKDTLYSSSGMILEAGHLHPLSSDI